MYDGYTHISDAVNKTNKRLDDILNNRLIPIITSSKKETDRIGGYYPTDQIVIAGRTGTGKTAVILRDLLDFCNWELNPKWKGKLIILYDTWEMPDWRNILRLYSRTTETPVKDILNHQVKITQEFFTRLKILGNMFSEAPVYFSNNTQTVKEWVDNKKLIQEKNPNKLIINIVDHTRLVTRYNERTEEELLTNFMKAGMYIKNRYEHINIFLSQMNRNIETKAATREAIGMNTPIASDIFGGDSVFQCADIVTALHRPGLYKIPAWNGISTGIDLNDPNKEDNLLLKCILKQRDGWTGALTFKHNLAINHIEDM